MSKLKPGDKVTWNIQKGVNPKGILIRIIENYAGYGDKRYEVIATEDITFHGHYGQNNIMKGEILMPLKLRKIK